HVLVTNMNSPDIVALQEIQDDTGSANDGVVSSDLTLQTLANAVVAAGGPAYAYAYVAPADRRRGGDPGGNFRMAFFYDPTRVELIVGSVEAVTDPNLVDGDAFANSRRPLRASFRFNEATFHLFDVHFTSKGGSTPLFGRVQPSV